MTYSPIAVGLLLGRQTDGRPVPKEVIEGPNFSGVLATVNQIAEEAGKTAAQVAIAWVLSHRQVSAAMTGPDSPEQLEENLGGVDWELSSDQRERLDRASAWALGEGVRR